MFEIVLLPDDLIQTAESACASSGRTPDKQIELWAQMGRAVDEVLKKGEFTWHINTRLAVDEG